jgi:hypothetical protein
MKLKKKSRLVSRGDGEDVEAAITWLACRRRIM